MSAPAGYTSAGEIQYDVELHYDEYSPVMREVLSCERCGALVAGRDVGVHNEWHRMVDPLPERPSLVP